MAEETEQKVTKKMLSQDELMEIWKKDAFWGQAGSFQVDPFTGKRTKQED
jgi:hypothetical protein